MKFTRGYVTGLALGTPFLINPLPVKMAALFLLPFIAHVLTRGIRFAPFFRPNAFLLVTYLLAAAYALALAIGSTPFVKDVAINLILSGGVIVLYLSSAGESDHPEDIIPGFFFGICSTAVIISLVGLVKYWLQLHGIVVGMLVNSCFDRYPQGTTFCGDYNLFGLYLAVAAIGLSVYILQSKNWRKELLLSLALAIVLTAGFFAGSRRFSFVVLTVPAVWLSFAIFEKRFFNVLKVAVVPSVLSLGLYILFAQPYPAVPPENMLVLEVPQILPTGEMSSPVTKGAPADNLAARSVSPSAMSGTMTAETSFGLDTRLDRWRYGIELIRENGFILGNGLKYQKEFSCRFVGCEFIDYPHSPVLSAWIAFGVAGLGAVLAIYGLLALNIIRASTAGLLSGATATAIATLPYSLISGDSVFSIPHFFVGAMVVLSVIQRKMSKANIRVKSTDVANANL